MVDPLVPRYISARANDNWHCRSTMTSNMTITCRLLIALLLCVSVCPSSQSSIAAQAPDDIFNAARKGNLKRVEQLLDASPELLDQIDADGRTPLIYAAKSGQHAIVALLLARGPKEPDKLDGYSYAAIHWAAMYGHIDVIRVFADHKIGLNTRGALQQTPLHAGVGNVFSNVRQKHAEVTKLLLSLGADPAAKDSSGHTPLHAAVSLIGQLPAAEAILTTAKNVDVNARDDAGSTPLHQAAAFGRLDAVQLLLKHGADPTLRNQEGDTPLDRAVKMKLPNQEKLIETLKAAQAAAKQKKQKSANSTTTK